MEPPCKEVGEFCAVGIETICGVSEAISKLMVFGETESMV